MALRDALGKPVLEVRGGAPPAARVRRGPIGLAELVAPDGVDRSRSGSLQAGAAHMATLHVRGFPPALKLAWLADAGLGLDAPGVTVHQRIAPVQDALARRLLAGSEDAGISTIAGDVQAGVSMDVDAQHGMEAAAVLRRDLAAGADRMYQHSIAVTVSAPTPEALRERVDALRLAAAQHGIMLGLPPFRQWEGYVGSLPLGREELGLAHDSSGRAVAMAMPTAAPGLLPRRGAPLVWGEHPRTGQPVIWDRWQAANPHALVVAESGSGKTYAVSGLLAQEAALAEDALLILDPKFQEYRHLVSALGGAYISLSRRAGYHINPLELPRLTPERAAAVAALEEDLLGQRIGVVKALVTRELRANGTPVDAAAMALLERALLECYDARGVTGDPATFTSAMPTLPDVQIRLGDLAADEPRARELARALELFTRGTIGDLFCRPSNIPTENALLAIDLSALLRADDDVLGRVLPAVVMDFFLTTAINRPTGRRSHLVLDEAHALLHSEVGARTLQTIFRVGRSLQFKASVITQSLDDLDESEQTRVLLENARTKLLLGLNRDSSAVARAAGLLGLNQEEARYLAGCRLVRGIGATALLLADGERTPLLIPMWPETVHRIVTGQQAAR